MHTGTVTRARMRADRQTDLHAKGAHKHARARSGPHARRSCEEAVPVATIATSAICARPRAQVPQCARGVRSCAERHAPKGAHAPACCLHESARKRASVHNFALARMPPRPRAPRLTYAPAPARACATTRARVPTSRCQRAGAHLHVRARAIARAGICTRPRAYAHTRMPAYASVRAHIPVPSGAWGRAGTGDSTRPYARQCTQGVVTKRACRAQSVRKGVRNNTRAHMGVRTRTRARACNAHVCTHACVRVRIRMSARVRLRMCARAREQCNTHGPRADGHSQATMRTCTCLPAFAFVRVSGAIGSKAYVSTR